MAKIHVFLLAVVLAAASDGGEKSVVGERMTVWGPDVEQPVLLKKVEPPPIKTHARLSGVAVFEIAIDERGDVVAVKVLKPVGPGLTEQAESAVRQWKFRPARIKKMPVPVIQNVSVGFPIE